LTLITLIKKVLLIFITYRIIMGKKKIDKIKYIENKLKRSVAFCKRKRGFLKKAIELS